MTTYRDINAAGDMTRWLRDEATGLVTNKVYADDSIVTYTYTPDGLLLRETKPSGVWVENVYDAARQTVGVISSDGAQDAIMQRDRFGHVMVESNSVAQTEYSLDDFWGATNETQMVDGVSVSFEREFDAYGRIVRFARVGGEESMFGYAPHGAISAVSNGNVAVEYAFTSDALDAGYVLAVQGGADFSREVFRHGYLRSCIVAVSNSCGNASHGLEYGYDKLRRPISRNADSFGYNVRGEVVFSRRDAENSENLYAYDDIGNLVSNTTAATTNIYASNNRNQYASIQEISALSASLREINYDLDGNMTRHGEWTYAYDSGNRLVSVASNGVTVATMSYDTQGRRVKKVAADGTHRYFYDGWLLVYEHAVRPNNTTNEIEYVWGKDVSGTRDGAVRLVAAGRMHIDGRITAYGWIHPSGGGGSGGSIWLTAGVISGNGKISADCVTDIVTGALSNNYTGGGGRIALYQTVADDWSELHITPTCSGSPIQSTLRGGTGTVYWQLPSDVPYGGRITIVPVAKVSYGTGFPGTADGDVRKAYKDARLELGANSYLVVTNASLTALGGTMRIRDINVKSTSARIALYENTIRVLSSEHKGGRNWTAGSDYEALVKTGAIDTSRGGKIVWPVGMRLTIR